jgi:hypothetical protein
VPRHTLPRTSSASCRRRRRKTTCGARAAAEDRQTSPTGHRIKKAAAAMGRWRACRIVGAYPCTPTIRPGSEPLHALDRSPSCTDRRPGSSVRRCFRLAAPDGTSRSIDRIGRVPAHCRASNGCRAISRSRCARGSGGGPA